MEGFYSIAEFIRLYCVPRTTLYRIVKNPNTKLRIVKLGRASRIAKADAKAWADTPDAGEWVEALRGNEA